MRKRNTSASSLCSALSRRRLREDERVARRFEIQARSVFNDALLHCPCPGRQKGSLRNNLRILARTPPCWGQKRNRPRSNLRGLQISTFAERHTPRSGLCVHIGELCQGNTSSLSALRIELARLGITRHQNAHRFNAFRNIKLAARHLGVECTHPAGTEP